MLATSCRQGKPALSYACLRKLLGVSATTVRRWLAHFTKIFPRQAHAEGMFVPMYPTASCPTRR